MKFPVFDLHCDTALELLGKHGIAEKSLRSNDLHIDLDRASQLGGYCQCFACFTTPAMERWGIGHPTEIFRKELEIIQSQLHSNGDRIRLAKTPEQIKQMDLSGECASLKLNLGAGRLNGVNSMIRFLQNL